MTDATPDLLGPAKCARCWVDDDMKDLGLRIANGARENLEARDRTWVYLPSFQLAVAEEAARVLLTVVQHERQHKHD